MGRQITNVKETGTYVPIKVGQDKSRYQQSFYEHVSTKLFVILGCIKI